MQTEMKLTGYPSIDKPSKQFYPIDIEERIFKDVGQKLYDFLLLRNKGCESDIAYRYFGEEKNYGYLFYKIEIFAKALKRFGISKGDYITLCLPNMPETIMYVYACNRLGATPYLVDPRCSSKRIADCINISNSKLLITVIDVVGTAVIPSEMPIDNIVVVSPANDFRGSNKLCTEAMAVKALYKAKEFTFRLKNKSKKIIMQSDFIKFSENEPAIIDTEYDPKTPALVVNTSGTTGTPKGAMIPDRAYNTTCNQINYIAKLKRGMSYLGYIPFFSMYGSSIGMCGALTNGITVEIMPKIKISEFDRIVVKKKPNILIAVPKMFTMFLNSKYINNTDMSFAKLMVAGGDNMSSSKLDAVNAVLKKNGCKTGITYGYGATEAGNVSAFHYTNDKKDILTQKPGCSGAFYPGVYGMIVNRETGEELPYNQEGEVYITSPTAFMGYIGNENETANVTYINPKNGLRYYKSADKGYIDKDGVLYITGRYKRLMKRPDGHQVSSIPIENAICTCPEVKDCAVVGIKNKYQDDGEIPTAFIELNNTEEWETKIKNIIHKTKSTLSGEREMALAYVLVEHIPYTLGGKVDFITLSKKSFEEIDNLIVIDDPVINDYFTNRERLKKVKLH